MIKETIHKIRTYSTQNQPLEAVEELCKEVVYRYFGVSRVDSSQNVTSANNLQSSHFEFYRQPPSIHINDSLSSQFTVGFGILMLAAYDQGINPFDNCPNAPFTYTNWAVTLRCDLTLSLQPLKIELRNQEGNLLYRHVYKQTKSIDEFWPIHLNCLEKQTKNIALIAKAQQALLNCSHGILGKVNTGEELPAPSECEYFFTTDKHELGHFLVTWTVKGPDDKIHETYQYFTNIFGERLYEVHQTSLNVS